MAEPTSIDSNSSEQWRPVVGYEGRYSVSSLGRIRIEYDSHNGRKKRGELMKLRVNPNGYVMVGITKNRHRTPKLVHGIVLAAFVGPRPDGLTINHKSGVKTDNRLENLEYVSGSENQLHAFRTGLRARPIGTLHPGSKIDEAIVQQIRSRAGSASFAQLGRDFGMSDTNIRAIIRRKTWQHVA